jgi:carbon monoxide dehydrogenase subunit G
MRIENQFEAPGEPNDVMARLTDVERVAQCIPGAIIEGTTGNGQYLGAITLSLGPKRVVFRGTMQCEFDLPKRRGVLSSKATSNLRGARAAGRTVFTVNVAPSSAPERPVSLVTIVSEVELPGVLAEFARTGGAALANVLILEFAQRLAQDLAEEPSATSSAACRDHSKPTEVSLNLPMLLWQVIKAQVSKIFKRMFSVNH